MPDQPGRGETPSERDWLAAYDPRAFDPIAVTCDVVALTLRTSALHVLLVRRGGPPYQGSWALPGGFVQAGQESLDQAAARELAEETGLDSGTGLDRVHLEQLASYGSPDRDPRMHVVSVAYLAFAPDLPDPSAGSDAADAAWIPVSGLLETARPVEAQRTPHPHRGGEGRRHGSHGGVPVRRRSTNGHTSARDTMKNQGGGGGATSPTTAEPPGPPRTNQTTNPSTHDLTAEDSTAAAAAVPISYLLAFDHARILADALDRARSKIEYSPLATAFLGDEFTISDLRSVYEAVWGTTLHPGNFHRKVLSVPGFVESTGVTARRSSSRGGPRARLYRAGDARLLHPPLLRPDREENVR